MPRAFFFNQWCYNKSAIGLGPIFQDGIMDVPDFKAKLSQQREDYDRNLSELRRTQKRELTAEQKSEQERLHKLEQNYKNNLKEIDSREKARTDQVDESVGKAKEIIQKKQRDFVDTIKKNEADFAEQAAEQRKDFSRRLGDTTDTYERFRRESDQEKTSQLEQAKDRYNKYFKSHDEEKSREVNRFLDNAKESVAQNLADTKEQKQRLINKHNEEKAVMNQNALEKENRMQTMNRWKMHDLQRSFDNTVEDLSLSNKDNSKEVQRASDQKIGKVLDNMNEQNKLNQQKYIQNKKLAQERTNQDIEMLEKSSKESSRNYRDQIANLQLSKDQLKAANQLDREQMEKRTDDQSNDYRVFFNKMEEQHRDERRVSDKKFNEDLKDNTWEMKNRMEREKNQISVANKDLLAKNRDSLERMNESYIREMDKLNRRQDNMAAQAGTENSRVLQNQRKAMSQTMRAIEEQGIRSQQVMQKEFTNDRKKLIESTENERYENDISLRRKFSNDLEGTRQNFEERLSIKQKELEDSDKMAIRKMNNLEETYLDMLERQSQDFEQQRFADRMTLKQILETKDNNNKMALQGMRQDFDRTLTKMKSDNDIQVSQLVTTYEGRLKQLREDSNRELNNKLGEQKKMHDEYKKYIETAMNEMRNQYEVKMEKIRLANVEASKLRAARNLD
jgi:hypothetical protein